MKVFHRKVCPDLTGVRIDTIGREPDLLLMPNDYLYYNMDEDSEPIPVKRIRQSSFRKILILKNESSLTPGLPVTWAEEV